MKGPIIGIVIVLALLATGAIFYAGNAVRSEAPVSLLQTYANDALSISFSYPAGYLLAEENVDTAERAHHMITIVAEADAVPRVNSEGPTAITIDFYENDNENKTLVEWMTRSTESNLALGDGTYTPVSVDGTDAFQYSWSGLYEGETTAFLHAGRIVAVSVTYQSMADQIYVDYQNLLRSIQLR